MNPELRGKCKEYSEKAVAADPTLRLVRGWYHDPQWGSQEHWWTVRPDGTIFDPTAEQFPMGDIKFLYEEYKGFFPCRECGAEITEDDHYEGCCNSDCYGRLIGFVNGRFIEF